MPSHHPLTGHVKLDPSHPFISWSCCSGHKNPVPYNDGDWPCERLKCGCGHVICHKCRSAGALQIMHTDPVAIYNQLKHPLPEGAVLYGQVCPGCGLSHRAKRLKVLDRHAYRLPAHKDFFLDFKMSCICGLKSEWDWVRFKVCPIQK